MAKALKTTQDREGEIALAWIVWKYATQKIDCSSIKPPEWLKRRSRQVETTEHELYAFVAQLIVPAIFHWKLDTLVHRSVDSRLGPLALKLASFELYRDENELADQAVSFQRYGLSPYPLHEVLAFMTNRIIEPTLRRKEAVAQAKN